MKTAETLEKEFDIFFGEIGFKRISDIVGASPDFSNADYINENQKIIVELKTIDKDFFENGGIIDSLNTFVMKPTNIDENGFGQYTFTFPDINREGKNDTLEEPLRRILKKANKQIRETKERLLKNEGIGFVMIALNMPSTINPEYISDIVSKILNEEFSSISGYIICTPTYFGHSSETGLFHPVCIPNVKLNSANFIQHNCYYIAEMWCKFVDNNGHPKE